MFLKWLKNLKKNRGLYRDLYRCNYMINIQENINLAQYSTFRVGGSARYFVQVSSQEELEEALVFAKEKLLEVFVLGGGSNVIFSDDGFAGLVIRLVGNKIEKKEDEIICWAGTTLIELVNFAKENSFTGLEGLFGVPGTVGGAIFGNAGAFGSEISDFLVEVIAFDLEQQKEAPFSKPECIFNYRTSLFKENKSLTIISAKFIFKKGNQEEIENKIREVNKQRGNKQPKDWIGSSGSFFKNPIVESEELIKQFEEEKETKVNDGKLPAGWLIEKAGLLGKQLGGVKVNEKNGNFIINTGGAKAQDVAMMVSLIKQQIRDKFDIQLQTEVQLVGF